MPNEEQLSRLINDGVDNWNHWRNGNPSVGVDLTGANLRGADLRHINLGHADLRGVDLSRAYMGWSSLVQANLCEANLREAGLYQADLRGVKLCGASLIGANLLEADLTQADLRGAILRGVDLRYACLVTADLSEADLTWASFVQTNFKQAKLNGCRIYGISAWGVDLDDAEQKQLIITPGEGLPEYGEPTITVDNLEVAQFIYLLLHNRKIRHVIDTITSKVVLILGRFTRERKDILDALRNELRKRDYTPVLFDFEVPSYRDITETVSTLAHMARFIVADITDAKSIPQELQRIVPDLPSVPILPLLQASDAEYGMFEHFKRYPWVLPTYRYRDVADAIAYVVGDGLAAAEAQAGKTKT